MLLILVILNINIEFLYAKQKFYDRHNGFAVDNNQVPIRRLFKVPTDLMCLAICKQEKNCSATLFDQKNRACLLYDVRIDEMSLVPEILSNVLIAKGNIELIIISSF